MIRPLADNVLLVLEPDTPKQTAAGVFTVRLQEKGEAYGNRIGYVLAVGPGHYVPRKYRDTKADEANVVETGKFQPTSTQPGERVVIRVTAGDRYEYTKRQDFADMYAARLTEWGISLDSAEFRVVREAEILAVIEGDSEVREGAAAAE